MESADGSARFAGATSQTNKLPDSDFFSASVSYLYTTSQRPCVYDSIVSHGATTTGSSTDQRVCCSHCPKQRSKWTDSTRYRLTRSSASATESSSQVHDTRRFGRRRTSCPSQTKVTARCTAGDENQKDSNSTHSSAIAGKSERLDHPGR